MSQRDDFSHENASGDTLSRDKLFSQPLADIAGFTFDDKVVEVFPDMIRRSVPGYETIVAMTGALAERYAVTGSRCYDLGCSLGASSLAMRNNIGERDCTIIAIDNSPAMAERCQQVVAAHAPATTLTTTLAHPASVDIRIGDVRDIEISNASMVVMNFTLQFIPLPDRLALLENIYRGLLPGGVLVLSEKIAFSDTHLNALMIDLHHAFKRANGYSELEVSQKRSALENVLTPETLDTHRERLRDVGFSEVDVWFQCFNFASLLAIK
ncbi:MAG: carboxy-S-adenosyl-L-methionine synthase CmoA [Porticoccaceae bacterium]